MINTLTQKDCAALSAVKGKYGIRMAILRELAD